MSQLLSVCVLCTPSRWHCCNSTVVTVKKEIIHIEQELLKVSFSIFLFFYFFKYLSSSSSSNSHGEWKDEKTKEELYLYHNLGFLFLYSLVCDGTAAAESAVKAARRGGPTVSWPQGFAVMLLAVEGDITSHKTLKRRPSNIKIQDLTELYQCRPFRRPRRLYIQTVVTHTDGGQKDRLARTGCFPGSQANGQSWVLSALICRLSARLAVT